MNQQQKQKLIQLFNQFAQEEQSSQFAVENLLSRTLKIINDDSVEANKINGTVK